jgi:hypothetical protein
MKWTFAKAFAALWNWSDWELMNRNTNSNLAISRTHGVYLTDIYVRFRPYSFGGTLIVYEPSKNFLVQILLSYAQDRLFSKLRNARLHKDYLQFWVDTVKNFKNKIDKS